jgi:hypothetical protein
MSYYERTPVHLWEFMLPPKFDKCTKFELHQSLREALRTFYNYLNSQTWKENCSTYGTKFTNNHWDAEDADKLGSVFDMQTSACHLITQPGHVNYIVNCFQALCKLQASLREDAWFFQFLSKPHANLAEDVAQLFRDMKANVTELNTLLNWNGKTPPDQDTHSTYWKFETNANDTMSLLRQLQAYT